MKRSDDSDVGDPGIPKRIRALNDALADNDVRALLYVCGEGHGVIFATVSGRCNDERYAQRQVMTTLRECIGELPSRDITACARKIRRAGRRYLDADLDALEVHRCDARQLLCHVLLLASRFSVVEAELWNLIGLCAFNGYDELAQCFATAYPDDTIPARVRWHLRVDSPW